MAQTVFDKPLDNEVNVISNGKVDKYQGSANSGKVLGINSSGNVTPVDVASARDFVGATTSADGAHGLVPAPQAGDNKKVLTGSGTWEVSPGARVYTKTLTITNASGAYEETFVDEFISEDMKPIEIEVSDTTIFGSTITVTPNNGSVTISCEDVCGTETIKISFIKAVDPVTTVNSEEFEILNNRIQERIKTINGIGADPTGNATVNEVEFAHQIATDDAQQSTGDFVIRTTGGSASLSDGPAMLVSIQGKSIHTGEVREVLDMTVTEVVRQEGQDDIYVTLDKDTFRSYVSTSGTTTLTYDGTNDTWGVTLSDYGLEVVGEPLDGDVISIVYVKEDRGTITNSTPTEFVSTGWNLYDNVSGYARALKYSDDYGFIIGGSYTKLEFSETLNGSKVQITPVVSDGKGYFNVNADGYLWVTGGDTTTYILMTWSNWTEGYTGTLQQYTEYTVDISSLVGTGKFFPYGLLQVGGARDEINLSIQKAIKRIDRLAYDPTDSDVIAVIESGTPYDIDTDYIYYILTTEVVQDISIDGSYTAYDHGLEFFKGTDVPASVQTLYGQNLVDKLRTDVLTKSQDLVNNLTTNDATKALSAAMGYQLNGNLASLTTTVNGKQNALSVSSTTATYLKLYKYGRIVFGILSTSENKSASSASWVNLTSLPSGYRPIADFHLAVMDNLSGIALEVRALTGGNVDVYFPKASTNYRPYGFFMFVASN